MNIRIVGRFISQSNIWAVALFCKIINLMVSWFGEENCEILEDTFAEVSKGEDFEFVEIICNPTCRYRMLSAEKKPQQWQAH